MSARPIRRVAVAALLVAATMLAACGQDDPEPLPDEPPYLCQLIPKQAVAQVQEVEESRLAKAEEIVEPRPAHGADSDCWVRLPDPNPYLFRIFTYRDDRAQAKAVDLDEPTSASNDEGWSYWRCGKHDVLFQLDLDNGGGVRTGLEQPIEQLLKIAQGRYAAINKCEIAAAPLPTPDDG